MTKKKETKKTKKEQLLDHIDSSLETIQGEVTMVQEDLDNLRDLLEKGGREHDD